MAFPNSHIIIGGSHISKWGSRSCETNDGQEDRPAIVCLHTAGRDNRQYHCHADHGDRSTGSAAIDMPAHGKSWPLPDGIRLFRTTKHTESGFGTASYRFGPEHPIVIGCSMAVEGLCTTSPRNMRLPPLSACRDTIRPGLAGPSGDGNIRQQHRGYAEGVFGCADQIQNAAITGDFITAGV